MAIAVMTLLLISALPAQAADVVSNGTFDADLSGWLNNTTKTGGTRALDNTVFGNAAGSFRYQTTTGTRQEYEAADSTLLTSPINSTDQVLLSFYWYKTSVGAEPSRSDFVMSIVKPSGAEVELWSNSDAPTAGQVLDGNVVDSNVTSLFDETGNYYLKIYGWMRTDNRTSSSTQINLDDIIVDVTGAGNNAPTVTPGATQVSVSPVNRFGTNTTTISADFTDTDQPGVGAFTATLPRSSSSTTSLTAAAD
jgi:hypothetical protein